MNEDIKKQKERNEKLGKYLENLLVNIYGDLEKREKENLCKFVSELEVIRYE